VAVVGVPVAGGEHPEAGVLSEFVLLAEDLAAFVAAMRSITLPGDFGCRNMFERRAGLADGGYRDRPCGQRAAVAGAGQDAAADRSFMTKNEKVPCAQAPPA
jgi:hypothetical protein